jgi:hypothetical protein
MSILHLHSATRKQIAAHLAWLPLIVSVFLALGLLHVGRLKMIKLGEAALGGQTAEVLGEDGGLRYTCFDASDSEICENAYERAGRPPAILWLGNSQNFAINRYQPGDQLAVATVHRWLRDRGRTWLVSYTQPNANFYEQAIVFEALARRYDTRLLILPVFMDKLREQGVRDSVAAFMNQPNTADLVRASPEWPGLAPVLYNRTQTEGQLPTDRTIQARVEDQFDALLSRYIPIWRDRGSLRGNLQMAMNTLRNKALGIHSYTKRPVDPGVYVDKMQMLQKILESAKHLNIRVLLYIPPYRQDISGPYDNAQYSQFKRDVESLAARYKADYVDLTDLVPGPEWATVVDHIFGFEEPDFMHFTAEGHRRLAGAIQHRLMNLEF